jgi:hypothetical protein
MFQLRAGLIMLAVIGQTGRASASPDHWTDVRRAQETVEAARRSSDAGAYLRAARRLAELAPRSPGALYGLAQAQARSGQKADAMAVLGRLARMGLTYDAANDPEFAPLRADDAFKALVDRFQASALPLVHSQTAFTLSERDLITEGIAHDPRTGSFFVSSVRRRKIVRVSREGMPSDFVAPGADGPLGVFALAADPERRALWATTAAVVAMEGYRKEEDEGRTRLVEYDLDSGRPRRAFGPPPGMAGAQLGDLALSPEGRVFVADPAGGRIYTLAPGARALAVLLPPGRLRSPQGMAISPDGRWLLVADYAQGLARVDARTGAATLLEGPADAALTGIDGLVWTSDGLVAIQNGLRPHRILRLRLDPALARITEAAVIERAHPEWAEPTLGVAVGDDVFYVARSQWPLVGPDGALRRDALQPALVLRLRR